MIHKGFDFNTLGGFPFNQQRLEYMQAAYGDLSGMLASYIGGNAIVSGCILTGNRVSDGWVVVNGELLPFSEGDLRDTIIIREIRTPLIFENGQSQNVQFSRVVQFSTGANTIEWSSLVRLNSLRAVSAHIDRIDNPHGVTKAQVGLSNIPNAVTDDPNVSDSEILASSKMVRSLIPYKGSIDLNIAESFKSIRIANTAIIPSRYVLTAHIYEAVTYGNLQDIVLRNELITDVRLSVYIPENRSDIDFIYDNAKMVAGKQYIFSYTLTAL